MTDEMRAKKVRWGDAQREQVYHRMFEWLGADYLSTNEPWDSTSDPTGACVFRNTQRHRMAFAHAQQLLQLPKIQRRTLLSFYELHELIYASYRKWAAGRQAKVAAPGPLPITVIAPPPSELNDVSLHARLLSIEFELVKRQLDQNNQLIANLSAAYAAQTAQLAEQTKALSALNDTICDLIDTVDALSPSKPSKPPKQKRLVAAVIGVYDSYRPIWQEKLDALNARTGNKLKFALYHGREGSFGWYDLCFYMTGNSAHTTYDNVKRDARNAGAKFVHVTTAGSISALLIAAEAEIKLLP